MGGGVQPIGLIEEGAVVRAHPNSTLLRISGHCHSLGFGVSRFTHFWEGKRMGRALTLRRECWHPCWSPPPCTRRRIQGCGCTGIRWVVCPAPQPGVLKFPGLSLVFPGGRKQDRRGNCCGQKFRGHFVQDFCCVLKMQCFPIYLKRIRFWQWLSGQSRHFN